MSAASDVGHLDLDPGEKAFYAVAVVLLVLGAGLMSGLTLGLLSLDVLDLEVLKAAGTTKQRKAAGRLISLCSKPHWLLCTLLLCNAACMEALPIFLDRLLNPLAAVMLSVTAILVFGEIIPQAVCSRYGVAIGAWFAPIVKGLMWLCSPVTWPLSKLLDWILGHEESAMQRRELKAMVQLHTAEAGFGGALTPQEVAVIHGAMDLTNKTALAAMTPIDKVFMLSDSTVLDESTVRQVLISGHSRLPVYRGANNQDICGLVLVKELLQFWRSEELPAVKQLDLRHLPRIPADTPMFDVLRLFQTGNSHMALLLAPEGIDVDELRRTRGRLESKDTDNTAPTTPKAVKAASERRPLDTAPFAADNTGLVSDNKPRKKRVSWRVGSSSCSSNGSSGGSSQSGECDVRVVDAESSAALTDPRNETACSCADTAGCSLCNHEPPRNRSVLGKFLNRIKAGSPQMQQQQQQDLEMGNASTETKAVPPAAGGASYCSTGCCVDVLSGSGNVMLVPVGIITLEDVMEELLQVEIVDETDTYIDNLQTEKVDIEQLMDSLPPHLQPLLRAEMLAAAQNFIRNSAISPGPGRSQGGIVQGLVSQDSHGLGALQPGKADHAKVPPPQHLNPVALPVCAMLGRPAFAAHAAAGGSTPGNGDVSRSFSGAGACKGHVIAGEPFGIKRPIRSSDPGALQPPDKGGLEIITGSPVEGNAAGAADQIPVTRCGSASDGATEHVAVAAAGTCASALASSIGGLSLHRRQNSNPLPGYIVAAAAAAAASTALPSSSSSNARAFKSVRPSKALLASPEVSAQLLRLDPAGEGGL